MKRQNIYVLMLGILSSTASLAQEISVSLGGYFNNGLTSIKTYENNSVLGYHIGVDYRYYLSKNWSLGTQVAYQNSSLDFLQRNAKMSWSSIDIEAEQYILKYQSKNRLEQISYSTIQIPFTLQYETSGVVKWYIQSGIAIGIITGNPKSKISINDLQTSAYYPQWDVELKAPTFMGYGHFKNLSQTKHIPLRNRFSWLFETGVKQELSNNQSLYIGAFFNLGLNNLSKGQNMVNHPISLSTNLDNPIEINSIWNDTSYNDTKLKDYHLGIKLRYAFEL